MGNQAQPTLHPTDFLPAHSCTPPASTLLHRPRPGVLSPPWPLCKPLWLLPQCQQVALGWGLGAPYRPRNPETSEGHPSRVARPSAAHTSATFASNPAGP